MADEEYVVGRGESIPSIAKDKGYFWEQLWNHNGKLKALRKNPNVLYEGDIVKLPELRPAEYSKSSDARHKFVRKGEPAKFKLQLMMEDQPRANEDYVLIIDGKSIKGKTKPDGSLEHVIPGNARSGTLVLKDGVEKIELSFGVLDPIETISGIQQRLNNLGFECGSASGDMNEETQNAIKKFQAAQKLPITGEPDAATKSKLLSLHQ